MCIRDRYITDTEQMKTFCREMGRPVMNNDAMDEIANDPESPWLLSVCNEIVNNLSLIHI